MNVGISSGWIFVRIFCPRMACCGCELPRVSQQEASYLSTLPRYHNNSYIDHMCGLRLYRSAWLALAMLYALLCCILYLLLLHYQKSFRQLKRKWKRGQVGVDYNPSPRNARLKSQFTTSYDWLWIVSNYWNSYVFHHHRCPLGKQQITILCNQW